MRPLATMASQALPRPQRWVAGLLAAAAVFLTGLAGCRAAQEAPPSPDLVATVGGQEVTYGQFERWVERHLGEPGRGLASDVLSRLFDQFIDEELLVRLAADLGVAPHGAGGRVAVDRLLAAATDEEPSDEEIAAWYEAHRDELERPERVRLRQILVPDRAQAERALTELRGGAEFERVARELTAAGGGVVGGPAEVLAKDELPPAYADAIFRLAPGEISDLVEADYGFHVFQVVERLPAERVPLEAARGEIADRLHEESADRRLEALVEEARSRYNVAVFERNLPFNYQGLYSADPL
jgi:hypothetical protein